MATRNRRCLAILAVVMAIFVSWDRSIAQTGIDNDFVSLFNGKDLAGWMTTGNWVVEPEGVLALQPKPKRFRLFPDYRTFIWSQAEYDDFVLDLEYKIDSECNSGVFLRCTSPRSYLETQICDSHGKEGMLEDDDCGALFGLAAPSKNTAKPAGEWNSMKITCEGERVQVEHNGAQVININLADSKKTREIRSGRIGLQNKNNPVSFRNIRIREL